METSLRCSTPPGDAEASGSEGCVPFTLCGRRGGLLSAGEVPPMSLGECSPAVATTPARRGELISGTLVT
jgi:hypothetical protein